MFGASEPVAPVGLRADLEPRLPERPCTSADALTDLRIAMSERCSEMFGSRPAGNLREDPKLAGAKSAGVHGPSLRSHVSIWLGAPGRKMKIAFRAVPRGVTCAEVAAQAAAGDFRNHDATRPPAPIWRKPRRESSGPVYGVAPGVGRLGSSDLMADLSSCRRSRAC